MDSSNAMFSPPIEPARRIPARLAGRILAVLALASLFSTERALGQNYLIAGQVKDGSSGVAGVTVNAVNQSNVQNATTTTDVAGNYSLALPQGTYAVAPSRPNVNFLPVSCLLQTVCGTNAIVAVGPLIPDRTNVDFSVVYSIGGRIADGAIGLSGVQVAVQPPFPQSGVTDGNGRYTLTGFQRGQYVVTPTNASYTFVPASTSLDLTADVVDADFAAHRFFSVSGRVTNNGSPMPGVNILLQNDTVSLSRTTDANGNFLFLDLVFGTYTVTPSLEGYSFNPSSGLVSGPTNLTFAVATLSLSGRVTDGVNGLANVEVDAVTSTNVTTTRTDNTGHYAFANLAGTYVIMPVSPGQHFNPARQTLSIGSRTNSIDFQRGPTVTDTLVTTCDYPSLLLALSLGGTVGFDCGGTDTAITLSDTIPIATNVVLDGASLGATLDGGNAVSLFAVRSGVSFTLRNLSLINGKAAGASGTNGVSGGDALGGAVYNNGGILVATNVWFQTNSAAGGAGGAGEVKFGGAGGDGGRGGVAYGGAIYNNAGAVWLTNCTFVGGSATGGVGGDGANASSSGAALDGGSGGPGGAAGGAAVYNSVNGTVTAINCTFSANVAASAAGGAAGSGSVWLGFPGNNGQVGAGNGGGIFNDGGAVTVAFSTFNGNSVSGASGINGLAGNFSSTGAKGGSGGPTSGGGILSNGGILVATNCTFFGNSVTGGTGGNGGNGGTSGFGGDGGDGGPGGNGSGGGVLNTDGAATLVSVTFSKNLATGGAAGIGGDKGASTAKPGRPGTAGASSGGALATSGGSTVIKNTILAYSTPGQNASGTITDGGNNLSSDATPVFTSADSPNNRDPFLFDLANNGGPTQTAALATNSPAIDAGNPAATLPVDQRYFARSGRGDIGAFEFNASVPLARVSARQVVNDLVISWPTSAPGYRLQISSSMTSPVWLDVTNAPVVIDFDNVVTNAIGPFESFYRLIY